MLTSMVGSTSCQQHYVNWCYFNKHSSLFLLLKSWSQKRKKSFITLALSFNVIELFFWHWAWNKMNWMLVSSSFSGDSNIWEWVSSAHKWSWHGNYLRFVKVKNNWIRFNVKFLFLFQLSEFRSKMQNLCSLSNWRKIWMWKLNRN